jgi:hypothetical protein
MNENSPERRKNRFDGRGVFKSNEKHSRKAKREAFFLEPTQKNVMKVTNQLVGLTNGFQNHSKELKTQKFQPIWEIPA